MGELSGIQEDEVINFQISALDHFDRFQAFLEISGDVTIHRFRVFQKELNDLTYLEGQIVERSTLPNPQESDYPNCRFTVHFDGYNILSGKSCPKEIVLVIDGFRDHKNLRTDRIQTGDKIACTIMPYDQLSEEEQSIQISDDLEMFSHEQYFVLGVHKIGSFAKKSMDHPFSEELLTYTSIFERHINSPISVDIAKKQDDARKNDLDKVTSFINTYDRRQINELDSAFNVSWNNEKQKYPDNYNRFLGYYWRNVNGSFWTLPEAYNYLIGYPASLNKETLDWFVALKDALEANGIQLIVSLVPDYNVVSSRVINTEFREVPDFQTAIYVKQLSESGIETLYSTDRIIENYNRYPLAFCYPNNNHPHDTTQDVCAEIVAKRLERYGIPKDMEEQSFAIEVKPMFEYEYYKEKGGYIFPENCDIGENQPGAHFLCNHVTYKGELVSRNKTSPILIVGNSFIQSPTLHDSFPSLLSMKMATSLDWYRLDGYGPFVDLSNNILSGNYPLDGKKVLVLHFGIPHLKYVNDNHIAIKSNIRDLDNRLLSLNGIKAETKPASQTKHEESQTGKELTPLETKLVSETKTVAETKPAETKSTTEIKSATDKPAETKAQPEEKPVPAAVLVVTAEEAEKLNEFALFLATSNLKMTVVEGEITERSELPDPQKSDYPNCRFTVHFTGNTIKSGEPCPKELSLIVEGFENYRVLPSNDIKTGDKVLCSIFPFEQLPEDYQSTQQADDLELFLLESFYVLDIKTIKDFTDNELMPVSGIFFSDGNKDFVSLFDRHINPPLPDHLCAEQAFSVRKDIERMTLLLNEISDDKFNEINKRFAEAWAKEKAKDPPDYNRVGNYVWRNLENSFWTLPAGTKSILEKPGVMSQQMLDCFLSLKQVLEANGVQLIVSLVPEMDTISARVIVNEFKDIPDIQTATYVKQLSEIGVETIYASDQIIKNYNRYPFAFFIPKNPHPSDTTQDVLADILADRLKRYEIKPELDPTLFSEAQFPHVYKEDSAYWFPENCDIGDNQAGKSYTCRDVLYDGEKIKKSKDSQIMVIGNSYIETPIYPQESLPVLLSYKIHSPIDWYRINSYGPFSDILIQLLLNPDFFLKNKKVLIMQVGTKHITLVNRLGTMLNIVRLDNERILLNNKKMQGHLLLQSNATVDEIALFGSLGPLSNVEKAVLKIGETGELTYSFNIRQLKNNIVDSNPIVCIIPHTCFYNSVCKATINGMTQLMYSPDESQKFRLVNLTYDLPAGTKEITMKIEGKPGTLIAIKDIQIWQ